LLLFGEFGYSLCPDEELVGAQVFDGLDVQGFFELLGVAFGEPLQCLDGGLTLEDGIRPSQQGTVVAKDVWMLGIAAALILDRKRVKDSSFRTLTS
jgi:hypothetical protein